MMLTQKTTLLCPDARRPPRSTFLKSDAALIVRSKSKTALKHKANATTVRTPSHVAWVDSHRLTQECMIAALKSSHPQITMHPSLSIRHCISRARKGLDLIFYHFHGTDITYIPEIAQLKDSFRSVPLIILADMEDIKQKGLLGALTKLADGLISTRTSGLSMAVAGIQFLQDGGKLHPPAVRVTKRLPRLDGQISANVPPNLTTREATVLYHLRQGKANKAIAYDLSLTEATIKVHIHNIIKKMGATNRTQAVINSLLTMDA
jgi:DNA-binding NarL/FixJ family response regulator